MAFEIDVGAKIKILKIHLLFAVIAIKVESQLAFYIENNVSRICLEERIVIN